MEANDSSPTMSGPANYRICVVGRVAPAWIARLGGMVIEESTRPDGEVVTALVGRVDDQAAFSGLLNTLYGLHLPVLSADYLGDPDRGGSPGPPYDEQD